MEVLTIWRKQNTATRAVFPMYDHATGLLTTGVAGLDSEFALDGTHGGTAPSFADCEHETTEIGTTGIYYLDIAAGEVNDPNGSTINIKTTTEHVDPVCIRIQTLPTDAVLASASGANCTITIHDADGHDVADAAVWVTSDLAGATVIQSGTTSATGTVTFALTAGTTYYRWASKVGMNFTNPKSFVAVAN
jgi:hypothetical protein